MDILNGTAHFVGSADGEVQIRSIDTQTCQVKAKIKLTNKTTQGSFF
jgi:hypothetical protein